MLCMVRGPLGASLALCLLMAGGLPAQEPPLPAPEAFVVRSLEKLRSNDLVRVGYTYQEKETRYSYDSAGRVTKTRVRIYEVTPSPDPEMTYRRLVSEDGVQPADLAKRDAEQRKKEREWLSRRELEGLDARQVRLRKQEIEERKEQAVIQELTAIFDIRLTRREAIDGRPAIVFSLEPRPGYKPQTPQGRIIKNFRGEAWIDEEDHELARLRMEVLETTAVRFGFIVRLLKGSRAEIERRKVDGEAWLPTYSRFTGSGRVLLVYRADFDQVTEYSAYRKRSAVE